MKKNTLFSEKEILVGPDSGQDNYIMAIESSCDETACAIVKNGREVISNIVASQIKTHEKFGGVIPEANYIETDIKPPYMALLISGGHTQIIDVESYSKQTILGETIDDAVGEAYDKVARLIGLPYPGGPRLDKLAQLGNPKAYELPQAKVDGYNFSFSGLKTAVLRLVKNLKKEYCTEENQELPENVINDICASFQECVSRTLVKKLKKAVEERGYNQVVIAGGVAANSEIRKKVFDLEKEGYHVHAPAMKYCTDNASMVVVFLRPVWLERIEVLLGKVGNISAFEG